MVGAAEVVSELHEQHVASKHRYSSMTGWASSASGSPPPETLTLTPLSSVSLRARPRELDRRAVFDQMSPIPLPANAVAFSEPSIPLGPLVDEWRILVPGLLSGLLADVRRLSVDA